MSLVFLAGYEGDGRNDGDGCFDIDECILELDDCTAGAETCSNIPGSFSCKCKTGYERPSASGHCRGNFLARIVL